MFLEVELSSTWSLCFNNLEDLLLVSLPSFRPCVYLAVLPSISKFASADWGWDETPKAVERKCHTLIASLTTYSYPNISIGSYTLLLQISTPLQPLLLPLPLQCLSPTSIFPIMLPLPISATQTSKSTHLRTTMITSKHHDVMCSCRHFCRFWIYILNSIDAL